MWTNEEKQRLIDLYPTHTDKELCEILQKTHGQLRGMKERLGLRQKINTFTEAEIQTVKQYYENNTGCIDIDELASVIGRPKTSIVRVAGRLGLTKQSRPMTVERRRKDSEAHIALYQTDYYKKYIAPKHRAAVQAWLQRNGHPRGMLGKHHTPEVCSRISDAQTKIWANKTEEERREFGMASRQWHLEHGHVSNTNTYSRCKSGIREDLGVFFRSRWEANIARLLNQYGIAWEYEPTRFKFPDCGDRVMSYCPDFYLPDSDIWIEVKGWLDEDSKKRFERFALYYPEENAKLVIIDEALYYEFEKQYGTEIQNWESKNSTLKKGA